VTWKTGQPKCSSKLNKKTVRKKRMNKKGGRATRTRWSCLS
jgi:hypothetical protein